jgi:hypothetical protein
VDEKFYVEESSTDEARLEDHFAKRSFQGFVLESLEKLKIFKF